MKKTTTRAAAVVAAAGTALAAASVPYFRRQNTELMASHCTFRSPKVHGALEGFRITQVSDLHNREFGKDNCRLVALTEAQLPDLLVITGDLMDSSEDDFDGEYGPEDLDGTIEEDDISEDFGSDDPDGNDGE